ncbi:DUF4097 family beta strand repeat-containing protein [Streptomyces sp. NPDC017868]|uniref:DUF4097 family beta strand repeat-containing protein n=1 Tax=Streptomyces sp. NPDC017868 TaxID=3365014 RepID=UPI0037B83904
MQNFATPAAIVATLSVPAGRIRLIAADRADTTVEVLPTDPSKSRDVKTAERTEVAYADGVLTIEVPKSKGGILGGTGSIDVTVQLPTGSRVEGQAAAAELTAVGRFDAIAFEGAYREINLDEVANLRLTAVDGAVDVALIAGSSEITTARGDIRIARALAGTVTLTTQLGDISIAAATGVSASLDAGTAYGRVNNSLKNDGTSTLDIRATTAYGDITARSL